MGVTMMKTSYSPIFNESLDFSCVIFDPEGQMLAQAEFCPSQIGTIKFTVTWTIDELGLDAFEPGDVAPPQRSLPRLRPRPRAHDAASRSSTRASSSPSSPTSPTCRRPGAKTPGGLSGDATEIFQEGLLLPPVKIKRRGEDVRGHLEDHPRQPPHAEGHLRRLPGDDGLARPGRDAASTSCSTTTGVDVVRGRDAELLADRRAAHASRDRADPERRSTTSRT